MKALRARPFLIFHFCQFFTRAIFAARVVLFIYFLFFRFYFSVFSLFSLSFFPFFRFPFPFSLFSLISFFYFSIFIIIDENRLVMDPGRAKSKNRFCPHQREPGQRLCMIFGFWGPKNTTVSGLRARVKIQGLAAASFWDFWLIFGAPKMLKRRHALGCRIFQK